MSHAAARLLASCLLALGLALAATGCASESSPGSPNGDPPPPPSLEPRGQHGRYPTNSGVRNMKSSLSDEELQALREQEGPAEEAEGEDAQAPAAGEETAADKAPAAGEETAAGEAPAAEGENASDQ